MREYFDTAAREYHDKSQKGAWSLLKNAEYEAVAQMLGSIQGLTVLEAGCGAGWYAGRLAAMEPARYVAFDALFSMAAGARAAGVDAFVADSQAIPAKPGFDAVLCAGALEFMDSPGLFFAEAARVLKPGGRLALLAPEDSLAGAGYRWWHRRHGFEIHLFTERGLAAMAEGAGLRLAAARGAGLFNLAARMEKPG